MSELNILKVDEQEIIKIAYFMGEHALGKEIVLLEGDLGAGKTVFAKAFAKGFGISEHITSPTFTIINHYPSLKNDFVHIDLYRIEDPEEVDYLGVDEYYENTLMAIEWPERLAAMPEHFLKVVITVYDMQHRSITFFAKGIAEEILLKEMETFVYPCS